MRKLVLLTAVMFVQVGLACAQGVENIEVGFGFRFLSSELKENERFRADNFTSSYLGSTVRVRSTFSIATAGVKGEIHLPNRKWSLSPGIQYLQSTSRIDNSHSWINTDDFFFFRLKEEGTTTEYVTLEEVSQYAHYISVPLQVRFYPFVPRRFALYISSGIEGNFLVSTETDIDFHESYMETYESEVADLFRRPKSFSGMFYLGAGINFGKPGNIRFGLDAQLPCIAVTSWSGLVEPDAGGGISVVFILPINPAKDE